MTRDERSQFERGLLTTVRVLFVSCSRLLQEVITGAAESKRGVQLESGQAEPSTVCSAVRQMRPQLVFWGVRPEWMEPDVAEISDRCMRLVSAFPCLRVVSITLDAGDINLHEMLPTVNHLGRLGTRELADVIAESSYGARAAIAHSNP